MRFAIGVDTGGTFTDTVSVDEEGNVTIGKALSTPPQFAQGVIDSLQRCADSRGISLADLLQSSYLFSHGCTVASNAMVVRNGAKTGLLTTLGHEDAVSIMRAYGRVAGVPEEIVHHMVVTEKPEPLVPKGLRRGVTERLDRAGTVIVPMDEDDARRCIRELLAQGVEALAVSFLWSFVNPSHEERVRELIREYAPEIPVTLSSELVPILGEFERTSTTIVNAYLSQTVDRYYRELQGSLLERGLGVPPLVVQAAGGVLPIDRSRDRAVSSIGSGPVAGVLASRFLGERLGFQDIICTDVGGTTFDVGLIIQGQPQAAVEPSIEQFPMAVPMIDVVSIGAGGGSICWVDAHSILHVGPQGAGSSPGPACYDRGGTEPTLTDADLILGYLNPEYFLGGDMTLNVDAARHAVMDRVARPLGMSLEQAAAGIYDVANAHMADLIRVRTVQRGHDPRDMVLFAYGGAGPMHAAAYGFDMGVPLIVVPVTASIFSAYGAAVSDIFHRYELSHQLPFPCEPALINEVMARLETQALADLERDGVPPQDRQLRWEMDVRYNLQIHEVNVPLPGRAIRQEDIAQLEIDFFNIYESRYGKGTALRGGGMEIAKFRVDAIGRLPKPPLKEYPAGGSAADHAVTGTRPVFFSNAVGFLTTPIYRGETLQPRNRVSGPAVIEYPVTTVVVPPGRTAEVDPYLNIRID